jgi:GNAT superfamily N-acetyltransferase
MQAFRSVAAAALAARTVVSSGLKKRHFDEWHPELDEALRGLPEADVLPHELFRQLMETSDRRVRRLILILDRGDPVAVAGLRNRWGSWEPVTHWILPGVLFPIREGYLSCVLPALGVRLRLAWWRFEGPPPPMRGMRYVESEPTYAMKLSEDFEKYWRQTSVFDNVRNIRNRCRGFRLEINADGSAEWTIRHWEAKWRPEKAPERPDLAERLLAAEYLQRRGRYYTLSMYDRDRIIAGLAFIVHCNWAVAHTNYRDPAYDRHGVMTRLMDLSFSWARDMGFDGIDLGGSYEYKRKWAPLSGQKWTFIVSPYLSDLREQAWQLASRAVLKLKHRIRGPGSTGPQPRASAGGEDWRRQQE